MWKYVTRRIKDTVERTYNVLDVRRTWTCGPEKVCENGPNHSSDGDLVTGNFLKSLIIWEKPKSTGNEKSSSSSSNDEDFKKKFRANSNRCNFQSDFLGALTWSGAIVCGWYTTQIMCAHRRRMLETGRESRCKYSRLLISQSHPFHSTILSRFAAAAPGSERNKAPVCIEPRDGFQGTNYLNLYQASPVNVNDDRSRTIRSAENLAEKVTTATQATESPIDSAIQNLLSTLGSIEFNLGVENLAADQMKAAVSHFKLATSHQHPGGTFNLGVCYEMGLGVRKDLKNALECYRAASALGHPKAMYNLGIFYVRGLGGLKKNRQAARECFLAAAKLGSPHAERALDKPKKPTRKIDDDVFPKTNKNDEVFTKSKSSFVDEGYRSEHYKSDEYKREEHQLDEIFKVSIATC